MIEYEGKVTGIRGPLIHASLLGVPLGSFCTVETDHGTIRGKVVGFEDERVQIAPLGDLTGVSLFAKVTSFGKPLSITIGENLRGKVVDALGTPICGELAGTKRSIEQAPPEALSRKPISRRIHTGLRVIDSLFPIGEGQRLAVIAPAGTGKSTLLGILARNVDVDLVVIGLVGERGREVKEFLDLTADLESKRIVVVATSDEAPIRRTLAPFTATAIAEYFRDQGLSVLLLIDSLTRTARAIRDVGLTAGELPIRHGYTPSVYTELPKLLERAGTAAQGSITALYTLLGSEGDAEDPLAEEVKSLLDGHIILSRKEAQKGIRPAIDPIRSLSRVTERLLPDEVNRNRNEVIKLLERLERDRDIVLFGGTPDSELKKALELEPKITAFRNQAIHEKSQDPWAELERVFDDS
jgi:FliI/YscN family ATPase